MNTSTQSTILLHAADVPRPLLFENKHCNRCGGSGSYSWNAMHGSMCYGCQGRGAVLTKRGQAAQNYLNALRLRPARSFAIGDKFLMEGFTAGSYTEPNRWITIDEISRNPDGLLMLTGKDKHGEHHTLGGHDDTLIRKGFTAEEKRLQAQQALQYQATLDTKGRCL